jgi:hypothetical protein
MSDDSECNMVKFAETVDDIMSRYTHVDETDIQLIIAAEEFERVCMFSIIL